jgi:arginine decarboxylase
MNNLVPTKLFLTKGVGRDKYKLKSFEQALRQAGVAQQNLVQVSSILPSKCKVISREKGVKLLTPGSISFCVMARADTNEHGRLVASSIGVAIPKDGDKWGYLSEIHEHGMNSQQAGDTAEDLAAGWNLTPIKPGRRKNRLINPVGCLLKLPTSHKPPRAKRDCGPPQ